MIRGNSWKEEENEEDQFNLMAKPTRKLALEENAEQMDRSQRCNGDGMRMKVLRQVWHQKIVMKERNNCKAERGFAARIPFAEDFTQSDSKEIKNENKSKKQRRRGRHI